MSTIKSRVRAIICHNNKLLLVQLKGYTTWCLPGGGIEPGEGVVEALERELMEELGVKANIGPLKVIHQFKEGDVYQGPEFFFEVLNPEDFLSLSIHNTSHGSAEIAFAEFRDPKTTTGVLPEFVSELPDQNDQSYIRVELGR